MRLISSGYLRVDWWWCSICRAKMKQGELMYVVEDKKHRLKAVCRICAEDIDPGAQPHEPKAVY